MDVTPLIKSDAQVIQSYADGRFRISGQVYEGPVIVTSTSTSLWILHNPNLEEGGEKSSSGGGVEQLILEDFREMFDRAGEIDVVLLGTGARIRFLDPKLKASLKEQGLAVEVMDTGAACHTYNVLMAEGRRVAAALLPV